MTVINVKFAIISSASYFLSDFRNIIKPERMEVNKDEADRCIEIAERYIAEKNREKAEKFLQKAERLFPTQRAKGKSFSF